MPSGMFFRGAIGRTIEESSPDWPAPRSRRRAPDLVLIVLDDVGFADLGCFGGSLETPHLDRLAREGLRFTSFHAPSLGSAARACLLTGRNHHGAGLGSGAGPDLGFPSHRGRLARDAATLAELLGPSGYDSYAVGRWDLAPAFSGPEGWPLARGFTRFYGFLGASASGWVPVLAADNGILETAPHEGLHLTRQLVDEAIGMVRAHRTARPDRPFFLYFAAGACHAPHHVPREWADRFKGRFDSGWDAMRPAILRRQLRLGVAPEGTALATRPSDIPSWESLAPEAKRLCARMLEVYAGLLAQTDREIGRLLDALGEVEAAQALTLVVSDNGASFQGGPIGTAHRMRRLNGLDEPLADLVARAPELGGPALDNHYPEGWAISGATPRGPPRGGMAHVPLLLHWPGRVRDAGGVRGQFHHAVDLVPTVLELLGASVPTTVAGAVPRPIDGTSFAHELEDEWAGVGKRVQYFEVEGQRALWEGGWLAVAHHARGQDYAHDPWALYRPEEDFSLVHDLSREEPERLRRLVQGWWHEAGRHGVLPLDDRGVERLSTSRVGGDVRHVAYPGATLPTEAIVDLLGRPHRVTVELERSEPGEEGVLVAQGGRGAGFSLFIQSNRLVYDYNCAGTHFVVRSAAELPTGALTLRLELRREGAGAHAHLFEGDRSIGEGSIAEALSFNLGEEPLEIGRDRFTPASEAYEPPFTFSGRLRRAILEIFAEPAEVEAARHLH